jgi:pimeloyl-ACP methyl ester carboxylesterase
MVTAQWDFVLTPAMAKPMSELVEDLETVMIQGCGHWTMNEKPEELNVLIIDWLKRRMSG